jgi:hypothetical protein
MLALLMDQLHLWELVSLDAPGPPVVGGVAGRGSAVSPAGGVAAGPAREEGIASAGTLPE